MFLETVVNDCQSGSFLLCQRHLVPTLQDCLVGASALVNIRKFIVQDINHLVYLVLLIGTFLLASFALV